jgi:hypothetical protein
VSAPLVIGGETQAPEGVLRVDLYVVRGTSLTPVASYVPLVPVGTVPFSLRWDPAGVAPGRVTLRVVATTLARGFSADVPGLVVPPPPRAEARAVGSTAAARRAPVAARPAATPGRRIPALAAALDDSGAAFGAVAPVLPYRAAAVPPRPPAAVAPALSPVSSETSRRGWLSFAAGLLVLLSSAHLHRALRADPRSPR